MKNKLKNILEKWIPKISLIIVIVSPLIDWIICFIQSKSKGVTNPYTAWDFHLILIFSVLNLIYDQVIDKRKIIGDESNILLNRNQSDYYEIWEACKERRVVSIDAYGYSFKTLWFNFIRKFLNDVIINSNCYDTIEIRLVSTKKDSNCFSDIDDFYNTLTQDIAEKIRIKLVEVNELSFFTGICVNKDYLWLSIREPQKTTKVNEHVREWKRKNNETSVKMLDWFLGIMDFYFEKNENKELGMYTRTKLNGTI